MNEMPAEIENSELVKNDEKLLEKFRKLGDSSIARELFKQKCENHNFDFEIVHCIGEEKERKHNNKMLTETLFLHLTRKPNVKLLVMEKGTQRANNIIRKVSTYFKKHRDVFTKVSINLDGTLEYREVDGNLRTLKVMDYAVKYVDIYGYPDYVYVVK